MEQDLAVFAFVGERLCSIAERVLAQGVQPMLMAFFAGGILLRLARWDPRHHVRRRAGLGFAGVFACYVILEIIYQARVVGALTMTLAEVVPLAIALRWVRKASDHPPSDAI